MRKLANCAALLLLTASAMASAERTVGRIGLPPPSPADVAAAKAMGVDLLSPYKKVRASLLRAGWSPIEFAEEPSGLPYPEFPEISCGSGYDAVCSGSFELDKRSLSVFVDQDQRRLPVLRIEIDE